MKSDLNARYEMLENYFRKLKQPKRKRVIECTLPSDAILYLFEHADALQIHLLVEKRDKEDYVVLDIEEDNKRVYIFQLLLDALRSRFAYGRDSISLKDVHDRKIANLLTRLKAFD